MKTVTYNENEWRLVPVVATEEMLLSGKNTHYQAEETCRAEIQADEDLTGVTKADSMRWRKNRAQHVYTAMLEAAPQPPVVKESLTTEAIKPTAHFIETSPGNWQQAADVYAGQPGVVPLYAKPQPDASRDADAARWRHVRSTAFREFDSEGMWLRFAAIRHYDGPSDRLNEKFVDSLVDAAMATGRGEVG